MDGTGREELIQEHLGPVAGESVECGVCGGAAVGEKGGCWWKRVRVVSEEVCEVKGVGDWLCYRYRSANCVSGALEEGTMVSACHTVSLPGGLWRLLTRQLEARLPPWRSLSLSR